MAGSRLSRVRLEAALQKGWRWMLLWAPVGAWLIVIFVLSGIPDDDVSDGEGLGKGLPKLAHLVEYGVLAVLVARAFATFASLAAGVWVLLFVGLYAVSDELHQAFVPGRTPLATDVLIDIVGGSLGWLAWRTWAGRRGPHQAVEVP